MEDQTTVHSSFTQKTNLLLIINHPVWKLDIKQYFHRVKETIHPCLVLPSPTLSSPFACIFDVPLFVVLTPELKFAKHFLKEAQVVFLCLLAISYPWPSYMMTMENEEILQMTVQSVSFMKQVYLEEGINAENHLSCAMFSFSTLLLYFILMSLSSFTWCFHGSSTMDWLKHCILLSQRYFANHCRIFLGPWDHETKFSFIFATL